MNNDEREEIRESEEIRCTPREKLTELLCCGNERVELSAAKELLAMEDKRTEDTDVHLEVTIKIV
ncbi:MAG: hypothetical protein ACI4DY_09485 [Monoglobaceae bacterium]